MKTKLEQWASTTYDDMYLVGKDDLTAFARVVLEHEPMKQPKALRLAELCRSGALINNEWDEVADELTRLNSLEVKAASCDDECYRKGFIAGTANGKRYQAIRSEVERAASVPVLFTFSPMWLAPLDGSPVMLYLPTTTAKFAVGIWHDGHGGGWGDDEGNYYMHEPVAFCSLANLERFTIRPAPQQQAVAASVEPVTLEAYDAGLLNYFGGGNVEWWWGYIRRELGAAHDFYQSQITTPQPAQATPVCGAQNAESYPQAPLSLMAAPQEWSPAYTRGPARQSAPVTAVPAMVPLSDEQLASIYANCPLDNGFDEFVASIREYESARGITQNRVAAPKPALVCNVCGVDRFKEDCKGDRMRCGIQAVGYGIGLTVGDGGEV